jgi:hypothetical protein
MPNLDAQFTEAMFTIYRRAKTEAKYNATVFYQMLASRKGPSAGCDVAKFLINASTPSSGYTELHLRGRLDLTVEAMVVETTKWHQLFEPEELERARKRLRDYHYKPKDADSSGSD